MPNYPYFPVHLSKLDSKRLCTALLAFTPKHATKATQRQLAATSKLLATADYRFRGSLDELIKYLDYRQPYEYCEGFDEDVIRRAARIALGLLKKERS